MEKFKTIPIPILTEKELNRFWSKISVTDNKDECWEWKTKTIDKDGYGRLDIRRKLYRANRVAYFLGKNKEPGLLMVCHTCDNTKCCNPNHLFLGTGKDNRDDCKQKGRIATAANGKHGAYTKPESRPTGLRNGNYTHPESRPRGENHWKIKLKETDIKDIIEMYGKGDISQQDIADKYGVSQANISCILLGKGWSHLKLSLVKPVKKSIKNKHKNKSIRKIRVSAKWKAKLDENQVLSIHELYRTGEYTYSELAQKFKVAISTIFCVIKGKHWKYVLPKTG